MLVHLGSPPLATRTPSSRHVQLLEKQVRADASALSLVTLRFLTQSALPVIFPQYLVALYHSMRTAGAVMEAARARSVSLAAVCPVAARLAPYWTRHIREEAGHDEWVLGDLTRLGVDADSVRSSIPTPEVAELMGTLHFWIQHVHPIAALSYFYVGESNPPTVQLVEWIVQTRGIPREALQTFLRHASIDARHGRELEQLIDSLPLTKVHVELMALSAKTVMRQLCRIYEAFIVNSKARMAMPRRERGHKRTRATTRK